MFDEDHGQGLKSCRSKMLVQWMAVCKAWYAPEGPNGWKTKSWEWHSDGHRFWVIHRIHSWGTPRLEEGHLGGTSRRTWRLFRGSVLSGCFLGIQTLLTLASPALLDTFEHDYSYMYMCAYIYIYLSTYTRIYTYAFLHISIPIYRTMCGKLCCCRVWLQLILKGKFIDTRSAIIQ